MWYHQVGEGTLSFGAVSVLFTRVPVHKFVWIPVRNTEDARESRAFQSRCHAPHPRKAPRACRRSSQDTSWTLETAHLERVSQDSIRV